MAGKLSKESVTDLRDLGGIADNKFDNSPVLQRALDQGFTHIYLPNGYWCFYAPVRIPPSSGVRIFGVGNSYTILCCRLQSRYRERGMIEYFADSGGSSWGLVLEHLHLIGNESTCHGIYLKQISYPLLSDISVEGFDGAGLLLDKCQDGEFRNLNIQNCGRTSGNRKSLKDRVEVSKTLYSAIHLTNTASPNDANNMMRFNALQCENNVTSPYISVSLGVGKGPIGIFFSQVHAEVRNPAEAGKFEFLRAEGGDFQFDSMALSGFSGNSAFTFKGYGVATFANSRSLNGVRHIQSGVNALILITNCTTGDLYCVGLNGGFRVVNCIVQNVTLDFPGASNQRFSNSDLGGVKVANSGDPARGVYIVNCSLASLETDERSSNGYFAYNVITEHLSVKGKDHCFIENKFPSKIFFDDIHNRLVPLKKTMGKALTTAPAPTALDPGLCSLLPLPSQPHIYSQKEMQKMVDLVNRLQILLNAEIGRRKDLEAHLRAANLLS